MKSCCSWLHELPPDCQSRERIKPYGTISNLVWVNYKFSIQKKLENKIPSIINSFSEDNQLISVFNRPGAAAAVLGAQSSTSTCYLLTHVPIIEKQKKE